MKALSPSLLDLPAELCEAVLRKWLVQTIQTYPQQTSQFLLERGDPFRNPVGSALEENLGAIFEQVVGEFEPEKIRPPLEELVRIRAVQDFTPSQAVSFLFLLKPILREEVDLDPPVLARLEARVDELALLAFDLYVTCRDKMSEIKLNEAKRRVYVLDRIASRGGT